MRRLAVTGAAVAVLALAGGAHAASPRVAALQVALRHHGLYGGPVDGIAGPLTKEAVRVFQRRHGLASNGRVERRTRRALGRLGRPLLGRRPLWVGRVGWDVSSLEFRLVPFGLAPAAVDGRFDTQTAVVLRRFQAQRGLDPDGIAGPRTVRALAGGSAPVPRPVHVVRPGESFFSIAQRYHLSPWRLARDNGLRLDGVIVPGQRLTLPAGAHAGTALLPADRNAVRAAIDRWSAVYGVDPRLARALAWMESGFQQDVVSPAGAVGVMQLLPETWEWVDVLLLGERTPRTYEGNVRAGVRYLRWQLDQFGGDRRLALAGYYQGARAVRERGLFDDTKQYVAVILALYGKV
jgi:LysM repeat protein